MRKFVAGLAVAMCLGVVALSLHGAGATSPAVQYVADGALKFPPNYRTWVYLTTGLGMSYGPAVQTAGRPPMFTNVFVEPMAYQTFNQSGKWPDKTIFVLEIYSSASHGSINKDGHYQDTVMSYDVAVKDESKNPKWAYYNFGLKQQPVQQTNGSCLGCHTQNGAVDNTFVQFYPSLLPIAWEKGVVRPGIQPTMAVLQRETELHGWSKTKPLLDKVAAAEPESDLLQEPTLNMLGYQLLALSKNDDAVGVFQTVVDRFPKSYNAYDSLADGYVAAGDKGKARASSEKALALINSNPAISESRKKAFEEVIRKRLAGL